MPLPDPSGARVQEGTPEEGEPERKDAGEIQMPLARLRKDPLQNIAMARPN